MRTRAVCSIVMIAFVVIAGCRPKPTAPADAIVPPSAPPGPRALVPADGPMGAAHTESTEAVIPPSATVASESDGAAPTLGVEERMKQRIAPAFRSLKEASSRGDGPAAAAAAVELRREVETAPYSPDAPKEEANFDAFNGLAEDAVQCASQAEKAAKENDREALAAAVTEVEAACQACHDMFRVKH